MVKKITTISIDEDILKVAKKEIPNLSIWVEDCLKVFLGFNNLEVKTVNENLDIVKQGLLNIHLATLQNEETKFNNRINTEECNRVWSKIFRQYRNGQEVNTNDLNTAIRVLNVSPDKLMGLLADLDLTVDKIDLPRFESWNVAKTKL